MKRVGPRAHPGIDKRAAGTRANPSNVSVVINQSLGINIVKGPFDQFCSAGPDTIVQLLGLVIESATNEVNKTHGKFRVAGSEFRVSGSEFREITKLGT